MTPVAHRSLISLITVIVMTITTASGQTDTLRIAQLLKDGQDYLLRQGNEKKDLDSAFFYFKQALALSRSIHSDPWVNTTLKWMGDTYLEGNDLASGVACFQQVIDFYHKRGDVLKEARAWDRLGECIPNYKASFNAEKARCFEHARQLYHAIGDTLDELLAYKDEADAHLWLPDADLAEKELLEVADGLRAIHYRRIHDVYDLLRAAAAIKNDPVKEVFYTMEMVRMLDAADTKDSSISFSGLYYSASATYARLGMWDRSLYYSRKGWNWAGSYPSGVFVIRMVEALIHNDSARTALDFLSEENRKFPPVSAFDRSLASHAAGKCYVALGDFARAEKELLKLVVYMDTTKNILLDSTDMLLDLGEFYLLTHRYDKADRYAAVLRSMIGRMASLYQMARIERFESRVDSAMGRPKDALQHFQAFHRLNDSLSGVQKAVQIQDIQVKYAVEQKDKDLRIKSGDIQLLTKQNQLQQERAERSRTVRNLIVAGLLLLLFLVYVRYRLKQQKNRQLEARQKEISDKNNELERLLHENEWLLKEVHHRVKNNLQVIMSLLKAQSDFLHDKTALAAVADSEHRVYAMSLIHQKLYKSNLVTSVRMSEYIGDLVEYLRYCFDPSRRVMFDLQVGPIDLDVQQAVPVGLIINEAITNSFKYAFPFSGDDRITILLDEIEEDRIMLSIADNGRGVPPDFDPTRHNSFGMLLISGLTEDLDGDLTVRKEKGMVIDVRFRRVDHLNK